MNFDASVLWVRDRRNLTDALDITPEFLRTKHGDAGNLNLYVDELLCNSFGFCFDRHCD